MWLSALWPTYSHSHSPLFIWLPQVVFCVLSLCYSDTNVFSLGAVNVDTESCTRREPLHWYNFKLDEEETLLRERASWIEKLDRNTNNTFWSRINENKDFCHCLSFCQFHQRTTFDRSGCEVEQGTIISVFTRVNLADPSPFWAWRNQHQWMFLAFAVLVHLTWCTLLHHMLPSTPLHSNRLLPLCPCASFFLAANFLADKMTLSFSSTVQKYPVCKWLS